MTTTSTFRFIFQTNLRINLQPGEFSNKINISLKKKNETFCCCLILLILLKNIFL